MWEFIAALIVGLLKWFLEEYKPKAEEGQQKGDLEKRLLKKLRREGWL